MKIQNFFEEFLLRKICFKDLAHRWCQYTVASCNKGLLLKICKEFLRYRRCGIYTCNELLLSHKKKNETMSFAATWMDLEIIIQNEVSQTKTNII